MSESEDALRIYLDNCCYNRPFDIQENVRVHLESIAKLELQDGIRRGSIEMVWSYVLEYEASKNPYKDRRDAILSWVSRASVIVARETPEIVDTAKKLRAKYGFKLYDSLHAACAISAKCDYMVTTDDKLLKSGATEIAIVNPIDLI